MIEARTLYRKKNHNDSYSFMLVLSTTRSGMNVVYFAPENASRYYKNIEAIYFDDFDRYLAFDRMVYVAWSKTTTQYYEKVVDVPFRVISEVTTAIKNLYDGMIVQDDDGVFHYFDEKDTIKTKPRVAVDNSPTKVVSDSNSNKGSDCSRVDANILQTCEEAGIPIEKPTSTEEHDKLIDLLEVPNYNRSGRSRSSNKKAEVKTKSSSSKRYFTEDEVLIIASMTSSTIITKYHVNTSTANIMLRNARDYINGSSIKANKKNGTIDLIRNGATFEEVKNVYPNMTIGLYNMYIKEISISSSTIEDDTYDFFESIKDNYYEMLKVLDTTSIRDFAITHGCNTMKAREMFIRMRNILSQDIGFVANLGGRLTDMENTIKDMKDSKSKLVLIQNLDIAKRLNSAYMDSYEYHSDIITGAAPIPESVTDADVDSFISLLHNRFFSSVLYKNRILSQNQKDILTQGSIMDVTKAFMINYKRASTLIDNWRRKH